MNLIENMGCRIAASSMEIRRIPVQTGLIHVSHIATRLSYKGGVAHHFVKGFGSNALPKPEKMVL
jgi:hypothetical protein